MTRCKTPDPATPPKSCSSPARTIDSRPISGASFHYYFFLLLLSFCFFFLLFFLFCCFCIPTRRWGAAIHLTGGRDTPTRHMGNGRGERRERRGGGVARTRCLSHVKPKVCENQRQIIHCCNMDLG